ncbi:MAG: hypothetical protein QM759_01540 [Terricaulis sp.]
MIIETPLYRLTLQGDWEERSSPGGGQKVFTSSRHATTLSVMSQELTDATSANTVEAARMLLTMRLDAENKIAEANQNPIRIAEPMLVAQPWGATIAYYGADSNGRQFHYSAAVWPKQILATFVESNRLTQHQLKEVMAEVLGGVEFNSSAV